MLSRNSSWKVLIKQLCKGACFLCNTCKCLDWKTLLCHLEKFTLVSLGRTSNSTAMCLKGRKTDFFSLLTLFYSGKTQRAFKSQASTQWKENGHSESLFCDCLGFLLWYCVASKFKCYLGDLAKHLPQLFHPLCGAAHFPSSQHSEDNATLKRSKEQFSHSDN